MPTQNGYLTVDAVTGRIGAIGLLPVIVVDDLAHARPLAQALVDSGLHTAEVTFRTPQALDALAVFAGHPELPARHGSPITRPSMVCSCVIGSSASTRRAGRWARASSGSDAE
jgi:hypothetical protein